MSNVSPANQHTSDEREQKCWDFYVESVLKGMPNATKSALDAGYSEDHARNITLQGWFKGRLEKLKRRDMFSKAEKVLEKTLTYEPVNDEGKIDTALLRVQTDVAKHITSTLGKNDGYSTKVETDITSKGERIDTLNPVVKELAKKFEDELRESLR